MAMPSVSDRPDERIRLRQDRENICRRFVIVQLAGNVCAYPVQDARPQEKVPGGGGLGVQHLVYQVTCDGTLFGIEFLSELVRVGGTLQRAGGQADSGSPALGPPDDALEPIRAERDALPGHEYGGFGNAKGKVVRAYLGQL